MVYRATQLSQSKKSGTRARILKEAMTLVSQGGFSAAAVVPVAKRSGIATGTIYRHFPSKAELVAEVFRFATEHELAAVIQAMQVGGSVSERLTSAVETFSIRALKAPRLAYALIAEPVDPLVEKERLSYRFAYAEAFEDLINEGVANHEFVNHNTPITAAALVGFLAEVLVGPLAPQSTYEENDHERTVVVPQDYHVLLTEIKALALRLVGKIN